MTGVISANKVAVWNTDETCFTRADTWLDQGGGIGQVSRYSWQPKAASAFDSCLRQNST